MKTRILTFQLGLKIGAGHKLLELSAQQSETPLAPAESAYLAREILTELARQPSMAGAMREAMENYRSDLLFADPIISLGIAISMIIIAATTRFRGRIGNFEIVKEGASAQQLTAIGRIARHLTSLVA